MKQFVIMMLLALIEWSSAEAQTFTQRLQSRNSSGLATVVVKHSAVIDELVNGKTTIVGTSIPTETEAGGELSGRTYKTIGYRVQVLAGGNSGADRNKANAAGREMKTEFPDESVYVHFYSPRWICRMGNYRTYEEAFQMLQKVREMGYNQATIVKGKITLRY